MTTKEARQIYAAMTKAELAAEMDRLMEIEFKNRPDYQKIGFGDKPARKSAQRLLEIAYAI